MVLRNIQRELPSLGALLRKRLAKTQAQIKKSSASRLESCFSKVSLRTEQRRKVKGSLDGIRVQLHRKGGG